MLLASSFRTIFCSSLFNGRAPYTGSNPISAKYSFACSVRTRSIFFSFMYFFMRCSCMSTILTSRSLVRGLQPPAGNHPDTGRRGGGPRRRRGAGQWRGVDPERWRPGRQTSSLPSVFDHGGHVPRRHGAAPRAGPLLHQPRRARRATDRPERDRPAVVVLPVPRPAGGVRPALRATAARSPARPTRRCCCCRRPPSPGCPAN